MLPRTLLDGMSIMKWGGAGEKTILFRTENCFIDADARVTIKVPTATSPTLSLTDINTSLPMGSATNGVYSPIITLTGKTNIANSGWINEDDYTVVAPSVKIGTVNQSIVKHNGNIATNNATFIPSEHSQTLTISEGYNKAQNFTIAPISASNPASITSGTANITGFAISYDDVNDRFKLTSSVAVTAPTVETSGYISDSIGTKSKNPNGAILNATLSKIAIKANLTGVGTKKPIINTDYDNSNIEVGIATTAKPASGFYVAVYSPENTTTVTATAMVESPGYGTTTEKGYTAINSDALTVGADSSAITYIPLNIAHFSNTGLPDQTYTDISSSAPILISGDYLYISEGYVKASKISLSRLIPDADAQNAPANYIVAGYTAYDNDGVLIVGTLGTYDGAYTIT